MSADRAIAASAPRPPSAPRFLIVVLAVPVLLLVLSSWLGAEYGVADTLRLRARATLDQQTELRAAMARITDAESGQRGFVITGDPTFLEGYGPARVEAVRTLASLRSELSDQPEQRAQLSQLNDLSRRKFAEMDRIVTIRQKDGYDAAMRAVSSGEGKRLMDRLHAVSSRILASAANERTVYVAAYSEHMVQVRDGLWIAVAGAGLIMLAGGVIFWRQDGARYRARLAAYAVAERNRAILDSTVDAIAIVAPDGTIETINAAATAMLGYLPEEVEGRDVSALIRLPGPSVPFHRRIGLVDGVLAESHLYDRMVPHRDGHDVPLDVVLGVMRLPDGDHIVASMRDVSERLRIDRMKDELMSTVSHELRTPLTSVIGALGLLRAGTAPMTPAESTRLIEIAENNSRRLIRLINDMLDIDRIQSGRVLLDRQPTDLRDVLQQACQGIQGLADTAGIAIRCHVPDTPVTAAVDADRVLQVITNLASNAVHVSPAAGTVTLGLTTSRSGGKALVTVDDEGPGIPAEFRDRIFGRFERAQHEGGGGTGLGLAISREIVDRHDGRMWFEDRPAGGTRFAFVLDLLHDGTAAETSPAVPQILVCEDDVETARALSEWAESSGHAVQRVHTGAETCAALARGHYAALLLDLDLPDGSALDIARALPTLNGNATLPVIVVAGADTARGSVEPDAFGIVDWIEKPVERDRVVAALRKALGTSASAAAS